MGHAIDPDGVGPLYHHGPELFPVLELIFGCGAPVAAALWLGRWRAFRARLTGDMERAVGAGSVADDATVSPPPRISRPGPRPSRL